MGYGWTWKHLGRWRGRARGRERLGRALAGGMGVMAAVLVLTGCPGRSAGPSGPAAAAPVPRASTTLGCRVKFVTALATDGGGNLWVGGEGEGLFRYDPAKTGREEAWIEFTHWNTGGGPEENGPTLAAKAGEMNCLGDDSIYALACDKRGRIWAGTLNHGVSVYDGRVPEKDGAGKYRGWRTYDLLTGPIGERVFDIKICPVDGAVWMATNAGLTRYSVDLDTWQYYTRAEGLASDQVQALAFGADGTVYAATQCEGLSICTPAAAARSDRLKAGLPNSAVLEYTAWRTVPGPAATPLAPTGQGLPSNLLNDVLVGRNGTVYVATTAGLAWSGDQGRTFRFMRGRDWLAKAHGQIPAPAEAVLDAAAQLVPPGVDLFAEDYITCLGEDGQGRLWAGHWRCGYEAFDPGTWKRLRASVDDPVTAAKTCDYVTRLLLGVPQGGARSGRGGDADDCRLLRGGAAGGARIGGVGVRA